MITASEARNNVSVFEEETRKAIEKKVLETVALMSDSIAFHSKNGLESLAFTPYDKSRFMTITEMNTAEEMILAILKENGYKVITSSVHANILKVQW